MNPISRPPLWNKSMTRYLQGGAGKETAAEQIKPEWFGRLGLPVPPQDPVLLGAFLQQDDAADAAIAVDEFSRGIRRAIRIRLALGASLHRRAKMPWKDWVEAHFRVGYACFNRYHVAAQLQLGLLQRGLPLLVSESQSRLIAPLRRHERFWEAMGTFSGELPSAAELRKRLLQSLGIAATEATLSERVRLHRILVKLAASPAKEDAVVGQALGLVRQALAVLERGGAA
jgi:hypothetical protein